MNAAPPPIPSFIPDTAPFSPEQRAWLNGFFAGLVVHRERIWASHMAVPLSVRSITGDLS